MVWRRELRSASVEGKSAFRLVCGCLCAALIASCGGGATKASAPEAPPPSIVSVASTQSTATPTPTPAPAAVAPIDWRYTIAPGDFQEDDKTGVEWITEPVLPDFPFDELIYSWNARLAEGEGFRLYLQVTFGPGDQSPWIYAGYWGKVKPAGERSEPEFDRGRLEMDQLLLKTKARAFQFKLVNEGDKPLGAPPTLTVITTDNHPSSEIAAKYAPAREIEARQERLLDLPLRRQIDSKGTPMPDRCQSAAVASAMEYFGKAIALEEIVPLTYDPEYKYPGIWPRTIGAATQNGFDAYIDRFRDWDAVRDTLAQNKVILASIRMPKNGDYEAPPYGSISGHIVAVNGLTADGRVIITDSALGKSGRGYRCQWLCKDFEKVWMKTKGGVGMVVCPPDGFAPKLITDLPPFPTEERKRMKDADYDSEP